VQSCYRWHTAFSSCMLLLPSANTFPLMWACRCALRHWTHGSQSKCNSCRVRKGLTINGFLDLHSMAVKPCYFMAAWLPCLQKQLPEQAAPSLPVLVLSGMGNVKANQYWEAELPESFRRPPESDRCGLEGLHQSQVSTAWIPLVLWLPDAVDPSRFGASRHIRGAVTGKAGHGMLMAAEGHAGRRCSGSSPAWLCV